MSTNKTGRRGFLGLFGAAVAGAAMPKPAPLPPIPNKMPVPLEGPDARSGITMYHNAVSTASMIHFNVHGNRIKYGAHDEF